MASCAPTAAGSCGCSASAALTAVALAAVLMAPDMTDVVAAAAAGRSCTPRRRRSSRWFGGYVDGDSSSDSDGRAERTHRRQ